MNIFFPISHLYICGIADKILPFHFCIFVCFTFVYLYSDYFYYNYNDNKNCEFHFNSDLTIATAYVNIYFTISYLDI